jgi:hypothetical protein
MEFSKYSCENEQDDDITEEDQTKEKKREESIRCTVYTYYFNKTLL